MTHPGDRVAQAIGSLLAAAASLAVYVRLPATRASCSRVLVVVPVLGPLVTLVRLGDIETAALRACALSFGPLFVARAAHAARADAARRSARRGLGLRRPDAHVRLVRRHGRLLRRRFLGQAQALRGGLAEEDGRGRARRPRRQRRLARSWRTSGFCAAPLAHAIPLALVAGALGQAGDLGESLLKRSTGVKDSGAIVPATAGSSIASTRSS